MGRTPPGETRERVFRFVRERLLAGRSPTIREVQHAFGFRAVQTAREHLEGLIREGRLTRDKGQARGYRLPGPLGAPPPRLVPVLGRVPAGALELAVQDFEGLFEGLEDYVPVQRSHDSHDELFGLRVHGDSMRDAGILDGDVVIVRRQPSASSGQIVVALVGDEATVKRLRWHRGRAELHPENPAYEPIVPDPGELTLLGRVVEVRRMLERSR
jgi:repressor LexA